MAVSQDDELFASYFWWRKFYRARTCGSRNGFEISCHTETFTEVGLKVSKACVGQLLVLIFQAYCQLCAKLHQDPPERNILNDIHTWWTQSVCKTGKIERGRDFNGNG